MRKIKYVISITLIFILMFSLAACGEIKKAETSVNNMFIAFKALNFEEAQKYINLEDIKTGDSENNIIGNAKMLMENFFDRLDYEIISSEKVDNRTVNVKIRITAVDMKPVLREFSVAAMRYAFLTAFSDPQPSEEETNKMMEELFVQSASRPDLATVTNEVTIKVVKKDNAWKITSDDTFFDALLGGITEAAKELEFEAETKEKSNIVKSSDEAISYVKAYYQRQELQDDPENWHDDYTYFVAEEHDLYYNVSASYGGNFEADFSIYQIDKNDSDSIIQIR